MARGIPFLGGRARRYAGAALLLGSAVSLMILSPVPAGAATRPNTASRETPRGAVTVSDSLSSVAVVPRSKEVVAVGAVYGSTSAGSLIETWTGSRWVQTATPKLPAGVTFPQLTSVWAASASDAWAVGAGTKGSLPAPILLHFDGKAWANASVPRLPAGAAFSAVGGSSADNLWAVGTIITNPTTYVGKPFEAHFNGKAWSVSEVGPAGGTIASISVVSAQDAWAIGGVFSPTKNTPFILHFNGTRWLNVSAPIPAGSYLQAVSAKGTAVWISGDTVKGSSITAAYFLHLSGSRWLRLAAPKGVSTGVRALTTVSSDVVWAVASTATGVVSAEYASGHFTVTKLPVAGNGPSVAAMAGSSSSDLWVVGGYWTGKICGSNELAVSYHHTSSWMIARMPFVKTAAAPALSPRC